MSDGAKSSESAILRHLQEMMLPEVLMVIGFLTAFVAILFGLPSPTTLGQDVAGFLFGVTLLAVGYVLLPGDSSE